VLAISALLVAVPAQAKPWQCVLWPKTCPAPVSAPANPEPPLSQPAPIQPAPPITGIKNTLETPPRPTVKVAPKPPKRIKSNFAKPKRKVVALPWWCARIPKGTTIAQIEDAAPTFGVTLTPENRRQAWACLASKG
jgi:hypothetical protein